MAFSGSIDTVRTSNINQKVEGVKSFNNQIYIYNQSGITPNVYGLYVKDRNAAIQNSILYLIASDLKLTSGGSITVDGGIQEIINTTNYPIVSDVSQYSKYTQFKYISGSSDPDYNITIYQDGVRDKDGHPYTLNTTTIYNNGYITQSLLAQTYNDRKNELCVGVSADGKETRPNSDNDVFLGTSWARWRQVFAGSSTISTSDERVKQNIDEIPENVLNAWGEVNFLQFKFKDAVEEKGENKARFHTGVIAQQIRDIFSKHGLDASKYGLFCYDEWIDKDTGEQKSLYSIRYEECLCMETAYSRYKTKQFEQRLKAIESRFENVSIENNSN